MKDDIHQLIWDQIDLVADQEALIYLYNLIEKEAEVAERFESIKQFDQVLKEFISGDELVQVQLKDNILSRLNINGQGDSVVPKISRIKISLFWILFISVLSFVSLVIAYSNSIFDSALDFKFDYYIMFVLLTSFFAVCVWLFIAELLHYNKLKSSCGYQT